MIDNFCIYLCFIFKALFYITLILFVFYFVGKKIERHFLKYRANFELKETMEAFEKSENQFWKDIERIK